MVSILLLDGKSHLPSDFCRNYHVVPSRHFDGYLQPSCGYLQPQCVYLQPRCGYPQQHYGYPRPPPGYSQPLHGYPQLQCWYRLLAQSERVLLSSRMTNETDRTHIEDMKDPDKVLLPSSNLLLVALREDKSKHCIPFTLF